MARIPGALEMVPQERQATSQNAASIEAFIGWSRTSKRLLYASVLLVFLVITIVALLPQISLYTPLLRSSNATATNERIGKLGTYGDSFGMATALFTGLGLIGLVYTSLLSRYQLFIQQATMALQQQEILMLKEEKENSRAELILAPSRLGRLIPSRTPGIGNKEYDSVYAKIKVLNIGPATAKDCRAYLLRIEELRDGTSHETEEIDALRLRWAYEPSDNEQHKGIDIPRGVPIHFDVLSTKAEPVENPIYVQAYSSHIMRQFTKKMRLGTTYTFHIQVVAENAESQMICVKISLGDQINDMTVLSAAPTTAASRDTAPPPPAAGT